MFILPHLPSLWLQQMIEKFGSSNFGILFLLYFFGYIRRMDANFVEKSEIGKSLRKVIEGSTVIRESRFARIILGKIFYDVVSLDIGRDHTSIILQKFYVELRRMIKFRKVM